MKVHKFMLLIILLSFVQAKYIHIYSLYTESHKPLYINWFLPSIKDEAIVHVYYLPQECPTGCYKEFGWKKTTTKKVKIIIDAIKRHKGSWFIYSDVDIQFFERVGDEIHQMLTEYDLVIQQDDPKGSVCSGFFGCRANDKTQNLWERVLADMEETEHSDQGALNYVLRNNSSDLDIMWTVLPETYFGAGLFTGKHWNPGFLLKVPERIKMHHANWTVGVSNKISQLALVLRIVNYRKKAIPRLVD